jgi:hypothetical protein
VASIPDDQTCTGTVAGQEGVCLVRCQNAARAGPFGGIIPVQMVGAATTEEARRRLARSVARRAVAEPAVEEDEDVADEHELDDEEDLKVKRDEPDFEEAEQVDDEHELADDEDVRGMHRR